jgi:hypothetical protein
MRSVTTASAESSVRGSNTLTPACALWLAASRFLSRTPTLSARNTASNLAASAARAKSAKWRNSSPDEANGCRHAAT